MRLVGLGALFAVLMTVGSALGPQGSLLLAVLIIAVGILTPGRK